MCVVWCSVVWCGVVWCGVVWCGVVLCCVIVCKEKWRKGEEGEEGEEKKEQEVRGNSLVPASKPLSAPPLLVRPHTSTPMAYQSVNSSL